MGRFADILAEIQGMEEPDKKAVLDIYAKYPVLDEHIVPAKEFRSVDDQRKALKTEVDTWSAWRNDNWVPDPDNPAVGSTKPEIKLRQELEAERVRAQELEARLGAGAEMTFEEIDKQLAGKYAAKDDLKGFVREPDFKKTLESTLDDRIVKNNGTYEYLFTRLTPHVSKYAREFGEDIDMEQYLRFVVQSKDRMENVGKAYEEFTAPKRYEIQSKQREAELDKRKVELEKQEAEIKERYANRNPTDTGSGDNVGHFQRALEAKRKGTDTGAVVPGAKLGDLSTAQAGLEALRSGALAEMAKQQNLIQ